MRDVVMISVLVALFVVAGVLVLVGVLTHDEPGLMWACETEGEYDYGGECFAVQLDGRAPYVVDLSEAEGDAPDPSHVQAIQAVVRDINGDVGFELLVVDDLDDGLCLDDATICIDLDVPWERDFMDAHGTAQHARTPVGLLCSVRTSNTGGGELRHLALWHEIGHCLGLAHDDFDSSIMRPTQRSTPDGQFPPTFTDHDVALLRATYLR